MGLYGNEKCVFNEHHPNPMYMTSCKNPEIEKETVSAKFCNNCDKYEKPIFDEDDSLEELIKYLSGNKKKMAKGYILKILNGEKQPWEVNIFK